MAGFRVAFTLALGAHEASIHSQPCMWAVWRVPNARSSDERRLCGHACFRGFPGPAGAALCRALDALRLGEMERKAVMTPDDGEDNGAPGGPVLDELRGLYACRS